MVRACLARLADLTRRGETTPDRHRAAIVLMGVGAIGVSLGGLFVRHLEAASAWQLNAYRGLVGGLILLAVLIGRQRARVTGAFRSMPRRAWIGATCLGFAPISYMLSLERTTVANTQFVLSATPFLTAALALAFLGERLRTATTIAMLTALLGIGLMLGEGVATGNMDGDLLALTTVILFSTFGVITRSLRATDMLPVIVVSSFITMAAGLIGAGGDAAVTARDLWLCIVWGSIAGICGDWIFVIASRHLLAAETTLLIMMVPSVLGPLWVWWLLDEVASPTTLAGGALVLAAVTTWAVRDARGALAGRPQAAPSRPR
jgi:drug/metabolite transporter (DMT)-like permease